MAHDHSDDINYHDHENTGKHEDHHNHHKKVIPPISASRRKLIIILIVIGVIIAWYLISTGISNLKNIDPSASIQTNQNSIQKAVAGQPATAFYFTLNNYWVGILAFKPETPSVR